MDHSLSPNEPPLIPIKSPFPYGFPMVFCCGKASQVALFQLSAEGKLSQRSDLQLAEAW